VRKKIRHQVVRGNGKRKARDKHTSCCRYLGLVNRLIINYGIIVKIKQSETDRSSAKVLTVRRHLPRRLGTRKLYYLLKHTFEESHLAVGRDKLFEVLTGKKDVNYQNAENM